MFRGTMDALNLYTESDTLSSHLGDELNDLDKDVERDVFGRDHLGALGEQAVDNALQATLCHCVALTLDSHHVHPV
jgi:hypothetical protein